MVSRTSLWLHNGKVPEADAVKAQLWLRYVHILLSIYLYIACTVVHLGPELPLPRMVRQPKVHSDQGHYW